MGTMQCTHGLRRQFPDINRNKPPPEKVQITLMLESKDETSKEVKLAH